MKHQDSITQLTNKLSALVGLAKKYNLFEHIDRVEQQKRDLGEPLLIMIVGKGNFGKSTLINALVGADVAPVSIKPKTWKIDLYQPTPKEEYAELTWSNQPYTPVRCSIAEAERVCEEQETTAKQKKRERETWKSDLLQVRWFRKMSWPSSQDVVLVDTPGFAQERSDIQVEKFYIHGSQGFQIETNDPFEYYYNRSEIVLWCIKATNLEDQSTKESMEKVCGLDGSREVIGLLTFGDRIPEVDKERIRLRALELFGAWVKDFFYVSAGGEGIEKEQSIDFLREKIQQKFITHAIDYKIQQKEQHVQVEAANVLLPVDAFMDLGASNAKLLVGVDEDGVKKIDRISQSMVEVLERTWDAFGQKAKSRVDQFWVESEGNSTGFEKLMKSKSFDWADVKKKNHELLEEAQRKLQVDCRSLFHQLSWKGASVGSLGLSVKQMQSTFTIEKVAFKKDIDFQFSLSGMEGVGAGAAAGVAGAVIGGLLLGPVGALAGGALSAWLGGGAGRESAVKEKASQAIASCVEHYKKTIKEELEQLTSKTKKMFQEELQRSFQAHHGRELTEMLPLAWETDTSLRKIDFWPKGRTLVRQPSFGLWCCYEPMFLEFSLEEKVLWNQALERKIQAGSSKYKQQCEREVRDWSRGWEGRIRTLDIPDAKFRFENDPSLVEVLSNHPEKISSFKSSFLDEIKQYVFSDGKKGHSRLMEVFQEEQKRLSEKLRKEQTSLQKKWIDTLAALCFEVIQQRKEIFFFPSKDQIFRLSLAALIEKYAHNLTEVLLKAHHVRTENPSFTQTEQQLLVEAGFPNQLAEILRRSLADYRPEIESLCRDVLSFEENKETCEAAISSVVGELQSSLRIGLSPELFNKNYSFQSTPPNIGGCAWMVLWVGGGGALVAEQVGLAALLSIPTILVLFGYYIEMSSFRKNVANDAANLIQRCFSSVRDELKKSLDSPNQKAQMRSLDSACTDRMLARFKTRQAPSEQQQEGK